MSLELGVLNTELGVLSLESTVLSLKSPILNKIVTSGMGSFRDLIVYQKAFHLAMEIFEISKTYPVSEKYSIIDQMRRSSRSVNANIAEAYRKRRYPNHFISKISDAEAELAETQVWLDFSLASSYINLSQFTVMDQEAEEIMRLLNFMAKHPEKFS